MLAFLKLLNPKEWLIAGALIALAYGGFWVYSRGEDHVKAVDAKLAAIDQKKVVAVETAAQTTESHNADVYKQTVTAPPAASLGIRCVREPARTVSLPAPLAGTGAPASDSNTDGGVGPPYDPSGAALTRAHQADAQIIYLQARIRELETEMQGSP